MKKIQEIDNFSYIISLEQIKREIECEFNLVCSKDALRELPKKLNVIEAKKASFNGYFKLQVANQIVLCGTVKAKLIQPCSLTLEPVVTTIYKQISRTFLIGLLSVDPIKNVLSICLYIVVTTGSSDSEQGCISFALTVPHKNILFASCNFKCPLKLAFFASITFNLFGNSLRASLEQTR